MLPAIGLLLINYLGVLWCCWFSTKWQQLSQEMKWILIHVFLWNKDYLHILNWVSWVSLVTTYNYWSVGILWCWFSIYCKILLLFKKILMMWLFLGGQRATREAVQNTSIRMSSASNAETPSNLLVRMDMSQFTMHHLVRALVHWPFMESTNCLLTQKMQSNRGYLFCSIHLSSKWQLCQVCMF